MIWTTGHTENVTASAVHTLQGHKVGQLVFNGTFITKRLHHAAGE